MYVIIFGLTVLSWSVHGFAKKEDASKIPSFQVFSREGKWYFVNTETYRNYSSAVKLCEDNNMKLLAIDSKEENRFIHEQLRKLTKNKSDWMDWKFLVSGTRSGDGEQWVWSTTGKKFTFFDWGVGEPNNENGNQQCLNLYVNFYKEGYWDDTQCDFSVNVICQFIPEPAEEKENIINEIDVRGQFSNV